jgi:hypothetical protein
MPQLRGNEPILGLNNHGYSLSVSDISMDLFVFGDLASIHTSVRGCNFKVSGFATLPIW